MNRNWCSTEMMASLLVIGQSFFISGCGTDHSKSEKELAKDSATTDSQSSTNSQSRAGIEIQKDKSGEKAVDKREVKKVAEPSNLNIEPLLVQSSELQAQKDALRPEEKLNWDENRELFNNRKYEQITPSGEKIMAAAIKWQSEQAKPANARVFAQPAQCAQNISKVMSIAGFSKYSSALVPDLIETIRYHGGLIIPLPKDTAAIAKVISAKLGNKIPTGTVVGGCIYQDCSGKAGDGHIGVVGDIDVSGALKIYHNNWYRPDNENGLWKKYMVPLDWYNAGYLRKFMYTPWINVFRNPPRVGTAYDVSIELPAIDDLDPTNYYLTLAIPIEILKEVKANSGKILDSLGNQVPMKK